ncbi:MULTISPECIES: helicase-exonuclease AddAB subunit AddA [unclassified Paenibacillus]|uniref:helicase-exonuclease AddAB subunit AddA n=1 Tax=unclassified Paenibacillus TaxID=185978 RepID=UPI001AE3EB1C|nr:MULTISPECIES: helicase-exonuclease AddAB subunit AddA [unclassified Paenibacillus]MBP1156342.1 ATP-dependent helicase/nuclease subunit A [Paenibacillus sp. PvP091]MBP1168272.1 ATP-dependent helicase/nuclease subunit A [Paenibacillus sp. PvR098]MBP2439300.1 ATP-dependent helicase/nuclease subunit A [Paenibacillus sp. PvP052]
MTVTFPKPEGSTWTDDQWNAISVHGHSILVAAAAGSGKTAVLVERIIRRISDEKDPIDVDRLLVATFTKAAAAEMRHRISEALEKALTANPDSDHLRRQLALIPRASITTLHSFCMEVIQKHYQLIGLDPGFRIANETESALLRQDLLEELLEERYGDAAEEDPFWRLADAFSGDKSDDALFQLVQRLYDDSRSHPWPQHWLEESVRKFEDCSALAENPWMPSLRAYIRLELQGLSALLQDALRTAQEPAGPEPYLGNLNDDMSIIESLLEAANGSSWERLYQALQGASFGKLKPCKGDQYDKELQEQVKELRNEAKERLGDLKEELFGRTPEQYDEELRTMAPLMRTLADLVIEFADRYRKAKLAKGLVDFADLEHYCLRILSSEQSSPGAPVPSQAALEYREQFVEALLDEYQDTNRVQEAIVELISREAPGNRFMVGDVKQSIYRFRLAEPSLFQEKYKSFKLDGTDPGRRIDLARNFRSRRQVVDGTNYIFRQLMNETVGEIAYDERAELVYGAGYPEAEKGSFELASELVLIDRTPYDESAPGQKPEGERVTETDNVSETDSASEDEAENVRELEAAQLEARYIAQQICRMMGMDGGERFQVFDKSVKGLRPADFRDFVILLRATQQWAPVLIEELRQQGIPAYAELNTGYFTATEIQVVLSLLKIVDNPYQDIPLASVLRSPIVGMDNEELAHVRICSRHGAFFDAVRAYARKDEAETEGGDDLPGQGGLKPSCDDEGAFVRKSEIQHKLRSFLEQLKHWRLMAQQGSLADLIWDIYRKTGYFDFVGGLPGGQQRQANLRALYDRSRQYEATSFRGLFRFLRFVERMQKSGGDLGTARALGEQEDVVRIMTIHKSKGLEFPVVFVAGMAKQFNRRDLTDSFLLHKELGFGPKLTDPKTRVSYPTLPWLAIKRKIQMEMLAEEMRVLYVALTRAREKLILVASVKGLEKQLKAWSRFVLHDRLELPDDALAKAKCYLDWIGPAMIRHPDGAPLRDGAGILEPDHSILKDESSEWRVRLIMPELFAGMAQAAAGMSPADSRWQSVVRLEPVDDTEQWEHEVWRRLSWDYTQKDATLLLSKTSVTELKRLSEHHKLLELLSDEPAATLWPGTEPEQASSQKEGSGTGQTAFRRMIVRRPRFMEQRELNAAERGTVFHSVMQHIPLDRQPSEEDVRETLAGMVSRELLTVEQQSLVDPAVIVSFFRSELGQRLLQAKRVHREVPFSFGLPAQDVYGAEQGGMSEETVMLQGVIDCLIDEEDGLVLLDYKTDRLKGASPHRVAETYRMQLDLYARAVETVWKRPVIGKYIFLFDGAHVVQL